jgi:hypothetical protein
MRQLQNSPPQENRAFAAHCIRSDSPALFENVLVGTERADKSALVMDGKIIDFPGRGSFATASNILSISVI